MQPTLFNPPTKPTPQAYPNAPASSNDDTGQRAAKDMAPKAHTIRAEVLAAIQASPLTVHECAARLDLPVSTVQPRFSELRKMGMLEDSTERRLNAASGKRAIVWQHVTAEARQLPRAYREMIAREQRRKNERRGVMA